MNDITVRMKESEVLEGIQIHVFTDGSGGFFSREDGEPEALATLVQDQDLRDRLNQEYAVFLHQITGAKA
jgi:hypothetical protein